MTKTSAEVTAKNVISNLKLVADPVKADFLPHFFKTGKGEYGEGDRFIGVIVPKQRQIAKKFVRLPYPEIRKLLINPFHECRLTALLILVAQFNRGDEAERKKIVDFYLQNTKSINNWDLVDLSAPNIIGKYYLSKNKSIIYELAKSDNLWERRIAMIATYEFIKVNQFADVFKIAEILLSDKQDLIRKAVGWMLREAGKRNQELEEKFIKKYLRVMPRTTLRYAIEKFADTKRREYLTGPVIK
jgi:3-methyladenine DNA glycosylase AlkD